MMDDGIPGNFPEMKFFFKIRKYRLNFPNICIKIDKRNILRTKEHGAGSFGFVQNICIQTIISAQARIGCLQQLFLPGCESGCTK
jgi:hypothetical protein